MGSAAAAVGAGVGAVGGVTGGILSYAAQKSAQKQAQADINTGLNAYNQIPEPTANQLDISTNPYVSAGELSPNLESAQNLGSSEYQNIQTDPRLRQAQMDALSQFQNITNAQGLDPTEKAQLAQVASQEQQQARGQREAVLQNAAQRGVSGSGLELSAELQGNQAAANTQNQNDLGVQAIAQQRALSALQSQGQLGQSMEGQQYQQAANAAQAQDAINRFNTTNQQNVQNTNVGYQNQAQSANLQNAQNLSNQNTALQNYQNQYNQGQNQQIYNNALNKAGGIGNLVGKNANVALAGGQTQANALGAIGQTINAGAPAFANAYSQSQPQSAQPTQQKSLQDEYNNPSFGYSQ